MKLIIDIGNTAVKTALFEDKQLISSSVLNDCTLQNILLFVGMPTKRSMFCRVQSFKTEELISCLSSNKAVLTAVFPISIISFNECTILSKI